MTGTRGLANTHAVKRRWLATAELEGWEYSPDVIARDSRRHGDMISVVP
ncbi:MAG: hypothetical protein ACE149_08885 [Armatimonadota bacterium]